MRSVKISALIILVLSILGFYRNLYSWGLYDIFSDVSVSDEGLKKIKKFNPDRDILHIPELKGKDLFQSIDDLSIMRRKDVRKFIYIYLTNGREFTKNAIKRSYIYKHIIDEIFSKEKDLPEHLSMLPLLESGFSPNAVSRSSAVGLWQLMKNTSRPLGLKINRWIDERRDIEKSTIAAIRHLRTQYSIFKSWELALAAYNGGGGYVKRLINNTGAVSFWDLRRKGVLKKETDEYVPKFIALALIYKNPRLFGIEDELKDPDIPDTDIMVLKGQATLRSISRTGKIPMKTLKLFNPELRRGITPPYEKKYEIRIPEQALEALKKKEKSLYKRRYSRIIRHRIKYGETISGIAAKYKKKLHPSCGITA